MALMIFSLQILSRIPSALTNLTFWHCNIMSWLNEQGSQKAEFQDWFFSCIFWLYAEVLFHFYSIYWRYGFVLLLLQFHVLSRKDFEKYTITFFIGTTCKYMNTFFLSTTCRVTSVTASYLQLTQLDVVPPERVKALLAFPGCIDIRHIYNSENDWSTFSFTTCHMLINGTVPRLYS